MYVLAYNKAVNKALNIVGIYPSTELRIFITVLLLVDIAPLTNIKYLNQIIYCDH